MPAIIRDGGETAVRPDRHAADRAGFGRHIDRDDRRVASFAIQDQLKTERDSCSPEANGQKYPCNDVIM